jgi:hypothetical protein
MKSWTLTPVRAVALFTLAACNPSSNAPAPGPEEAAQELVLSCTAFQYASAAALSASYGPENLAEETLTGAEGESYAATVLYPNDPSRRLEIVWQDPETRVRPASISISGEASAWVGPNSLSLGQALADVETANGRPFMLWGFGWDYGGWVSEWNGGAFAPAEGCVTRVRFNPTGDQEGAQGDSAFASDSAGVRRAAPRVSEFGLSYPSPQ